MLFRGFRYNSAAARKTLHACQQQLPDPRWISGQRKGSERLTDLALNLHSYNPSAA
jgi:hypothetical protein